MHSCHGYEQVSLTIPWYHDGEIPLKLVLCHTLFNDFVGGSRHPCVHAQEGIHVILATSEGLLVLSFCFFHLLFFHHAVSNISKSLSLYFLPLFSGVVSPWDTPHKQTVPYSSAQLSCVAVISLLLLHENTEPALINHPQVHAHPSYSLS